MPVAGSVNLELYDISGRKLATAEQNLTTGTHSFNIEMPKSQICFLRATSQMGTTSIKMLNLANSSKNAITYKSLCSNNVQLKHTSSNYFEIGDSLQYIGYTTYKNTLYSSEIVKKVQTETEAITLQFDICYVIETEFSYNGCGSYLWSNCIYWDTGDYNQTLTAANGCDSIVTMHLALTKSVTSEFTKIACDSYSWNGETYSTNGNYNQTITTDYGCDSIVTLHLTVKPSTTSYFSENVCDSYTWNGETYTTTGNFNQTLTAINGCDSIVTLHLTVNKTKTSDTTAIVCDKFTWHDSTYTITPATPPTYILTAANGCDSVITLNLTITKEIVGSFVDRRDNITYHAMQIGCQVWMAENLKYLPSVSAPADGSEDVAGSYYYVYGYSGTDTAAAKATTNYSTYGVLYNRAAAMNGSTTSSANPSEVQGVCPNGWHLPSDAEWKELEMYLGMNQLEADATGFRGSPVASKLAGNASLWTDGPLKNATDFGTSGFSALPAGYRNYVDGTTFDKIGNCCFWWTATDNGTLNAWTRLLSYTDSGVYLGFYRNNFGFSVRCVRNN